MRSGSDREGERRKERRTDELDGLGKDVAHVVRARRKVLDIKEGRLDAECRVIVIILCRHCGGIQRERAQGETVRQRVS